MNIAQLLFQQAEGNPDRPFLFCDNATYSYGDVAALTAQVTVLLRERGVESGDHVGVLFGNRPLFLAAWLGTAAAGAVAVPISTHLVGDGLRYVLEHSDSRLLLAERTLVEERRSCLRKFLSGEHVCVFADESALEGSPLARLDTPWVECSADSPATILYTSGTTGLPKGAVISHGSYWSASELLAAELAVDSNERIMVVLPLFHANPQIYAVMTALHTGASLVLRPSFSASRFFDDARRFGATAFTYVGTVLSILAKRVEGEVADHGIRWCTGGGAPHQVWRDIEARFGVAVRELYGMTETGGWTSLNTWSASKQGSVGKPRHDLEVAVVDESDRPLPIENIGEIVVRPRAPNLLFSGYYKQPDLSWNASRNFWFHTGDMGRFDNDGFLHFEGRVKELIRRGGEMISPQEIELALLKHPAISDCAVVGVPDDILGEEIKAAVVVSDTMAAEAVRSSLKGRVPNYALPRYVEFVDTIPKTATEKVERHKLQGLSPSAVDLVAQDKETAAR